MRSPTLLLALALLSGASCKSSAPYTTPAVAINTALAVGAAVTSRASGGCYAVCRQGEVCNPRTGYCDKAPELCLAGDSSPACVQRALAAGQSLDLHGGTRTPQPPGLGPAVVSPATGRAPTMPWEDAAAPKLP